MAAFMRVMRYAILGFAFSISAFSVGPHFQLYSSQIMSEEFKNFSFEDKINFYVGTMFPEIWMITKGRNHPIFENVSMKQFFDEKNPFVKGVLYYHMINCIEESVCEEVYLIKAFPSGCTFDERMILKNIMEDVYVYNNTFESSINVLNNIFKVSVQTHPGILGYTQDDLLHWFIAIACYFLSKPEDTLLHIKKNFYQNTELNIKISDNFSEKYSGDVNTILKSNAFIDFMEKMILRVNLLKTEYATMRDFYESSS